MTTWPSNQTDDQRTDVPTIAGHIPPAVAPRAATDFNATAPTVARPYVPDLAWSAEPPDNAAQLAVEPARPWFMRSGLLTLVGGGLVIAAAAGIFGALHGAQGNSVDTTGHSAPPAPAPAAVAVSSPAPTPTMPPSASGDQTNPATTNNPVTTSDSPSRVTSQQSPPGHPTSHPSGQYPNDRQRQPNTNTVSTPPTWNHNDHFNWFTHRRDHDGSGLDHDGDNRSSGDHGHNSQSSHDQSGANGRSN